MAQATLGLKQAPKLLAGQSHHSPKAQARFYVTWRPFKAAVSATCSTLLRAWHGVEERAKVQGLGLPLGGGLIGQVMESPQPQTCLSPVEDSLSQPRASTGG